MESSTITIFTTGSAYEDMNGLIERIKGGDTPGTKQLLAILEHILGMIQEENQ